RRALALGVELTGEFAAQMAGVVLVDDVDVHLHPTWQYELVEQLRELFPRLTFVVSTHNPVTLLGARPGELYLVFHDEAGAVEVLQQDLPPGADVDSILLGVWFRLETTLDPTTAELHRELQTAYREAPESERVQQLRRQLRERNPHRFRALARSRLAEQVAEVMGEEDGLSPEQRRKLIESLRERAARNRAKREPHDPAPTV
ncbi:MAG: hypothetical protein FJX77_08120, partial [Armatimonadetes bacterium]|nr:hypothetical protein [Armatimonadota bacterium]